MGTVAVTGIGDLGGGVLRVLAQMPEISRLYALDVDETRLTTEVADAAAVASYAEGGTRIDPIVVDMRNADQLASVLARIQPDVVVNTATLQSWWVITARGRVATAGGPGSVRAMVTGSSPTCPGRRGWSVAMMSASPVGVPGWRCPR